MEFFFCYGSGSVERNIEVGVEWRIRWLVVIWYVFGVGGVEFSMVDVKWCGVEVYVDVVVLVGSFGIFWLYDYWYFLDIFVVWDIVGM